MNRRDYIIEVVNSIVGNKPQAEIIVERLEQEQVLSLGYGDADVDAIIAKFTSDFGTTKTTRQDRFAAHRLAAKYGSRAVVGILDLLVQHSSEKYAPVPRSVADVETKWVSILNFLRTVDGEETIQV